MLFWAKNCSTLKDEFAEMLWDSPIPQMLNEVQNNNKKIFIL